MVSDESDLLSAESKSGSFNALSNLGQSFLIWSIISELGGLEPTITVVISVMHRMNCHSYVIYKKEMLMINPIKKYELKNYTSSVAGIFFSTRISVPFFFGSFRIMWTVSSVDSRVLAVFFFLISSPYFKCNNFFSIIYITDFKNEYRRTEFFKKRIEIVLLSVFLTRCTLLFTQ